MNPGTKKVRVLSPYRNRKATNIVEKLPSNHMGKQKELALHAIFSTFAMCHLFLIKLTMLKKKRNITSNL